MLRYKFILPVLFLSISFLNAQNADTVWHKFTESLLQNKITEERLRPYYASLTKPILGFLEGLRKDIPPEQWNKKTESHRVGDYIHYIIPFTENNDTSVFCFTLKIEGDNWYFTHLENIFIRLDKISSLPTSSFPDLPEQRKAWIREEKYWSEIIYHFRVWKKEKGEEFALNLLKDGMGYFLEAKTWVPFVLPQKAFILYLCWEQSILRGNYVKLEQLEDNFAKVSMKLMYFQLYKRTAHLKGMIPLEDYRRIFETIWSDRANSAGWNVKFEYPDDERCNLILQYNNKDR